MAALQEITSYLEEYLDIAGIEDYANAWNGLQVENGGSVTRIAAAVDGCAFTIRAAADAGANLLLVHHGLFWSGVQPVTGSHYMRLKCAMDHGLAVYSAHLPLDVHPEVGNNAILAHELGLTSCGPFFFEKDRAIGLRSEIEIPREELAQRLEAAIGGPVHVCAGGPARVKNVGVVTGGAGAEVARAASEGVDTFITGEAPHWAYTAAEELGVNLLLGGHYATETLGVKALAAHLSQKFDVPWLFVDHPTGL